MALALCATARHGFCRNGFGRLSGSSVNLKNTVFMKRLLFLFVSLFVAVTATAQTKGVAFRNIDFAAAQRASVDENKPIFVDAYASWCGPCKRMASEVFTQESVGKFINDNFIPVKYDMEKGEGIKLSGAYSVTAYPTFLILDSKGNELARMVGGAPAAEFIAKIKSLYPKAK